MDRFIEYDAERRNKPKMTSFPLLGGTAKRLVSRNPTINTVTVTLQF
jgi:hypothetical protein